MGIAKVHKTVMAENETSLNFTSIVSDILSPKLCPCSTETFDIKFTHNNLVFEKIIPFSKL